MKTLFLTLVAAVLIVAIVVTLLIHREQRSLHRLKSTCIGIARKFDSWQLMR
ncbi:hypothetical protein ACWKWU_01175 [Chitinophaga lutea]